MTAPRGRGRRTVAPSAAVAVAASLGGVAASVWRPLAPDLGSVTTDLDTFGPAVLAAVAAYRTPRLSAAAVSLVVTVAVPLLVVGTSAGRRVLVRLAGPRGHSLWRCALVGAVIAAATSVATFPATFWTGYVHEGRWGFRTQGLGGWLADWLAISATAWLSTAVLAVALMLLVAQRPHTWQWWVTPVGTVLTALLVVAYPRAVGEVRTPTSVLPDGPDRDVVEGVLATAGLPDVPILVGAASQRTTRVNAMVTGLGPTERVVLWDTLLALPSDQVAVVLAHELAHHEHADLPRAVLLAAPGLLAAGLLLRRLLRSRRTGRMLAVRGVSDPRLVAVVVAFAAVAQLAALPVANAASRRAEAAADHRAIELTGRVATLVRTARLFTVKDLADPAPPGWAQQLWGTHPPTAARIRAAVAAAAPHDLPLPGIDEVRDAEAAQRHPALGPG